MHDNAHYLIAVYSKGWWGHGEREKQNTSLFSENNNL